MSGRPARIRIFKNIEELSRAAAEVFAACAEQSIVRHGRFAVALSGGSTPRRLYEFLGGAPYSERIAWQQVHLFWADERCVPPDHAESNYKLASDSFMTSVPLPEGNLHRVKGEEGPAAAACFYEEDLRHFFGGIGFPSFDLIILGAGEDGHTASLFPNSPILLETTRLAMPVYLERPKWDRVTLSLPVLNHASTVLVLASGRAKAEVVSHILSEHNTKDYPAGLVSPVSGDLEWMIDEEAAAVPS